VPSDSPSFPVRQAHPIRANAGVCLHPEHIDELLLLQPDVDWFEIHAVRYLNDALQQRSLTFLRQAYPLAIRISQISANATAEEAAAQLEAVVDLCNPCPPLKCSQVF
jgi:hypothetical protein